MSDVKRRSYDATRRHAQAEQTRRDIIDAAWSVFAEFGYSGATLDTVATRAGVAVATIYRGFGSKAGLLEAVILAAVHAGAEETGQPSKAELAAMDGPTWCTASGAIHPGVHAESGAMMRALREGANTDPILRQVWERIENKRHASIRQDCEALVATGQARSDLSVDQITDLYWTLTSIDTHDHLVLERGWSPGAYGEWLGDTFQRLFLEG